MPTEIEPRAINELIKKYDYVLIDFYSEDCLPCLLMEPIVRELEREYRLVAFRVDAKKYEKEVEGLGITHYPTVKVYVKGKEVLEIKGVPKTEAYKRIASLIEGKGIPKR